MLALFCGEPDHTTAPLSCVGSSVANSSACYHSQSCVSVRIPTNPNKLVCFQDQSALFPEVDNAYGMPIPDGLQPMPDLRPDQPDAAKDTSGPSVAVGSTPDEDVRKKAHGTFQEFMSIRDFTEAETCMRELALSVAQQGLVVATALNDSYDVQLETERDNLRAVVVHLADTGLLVAEGIQAGIQVCICYNCEWPSDRQFTIVPLLSRQCLFYDVVIYTLLAAISPRTSELLGIHNTLNTHCITLPSIEHFTLLGCCYHQATVSLLNIGDSPMILYVSRAFFGL